MIVAFGIARFAVPQSIFGSITGFFTIDRVDFFVDTFGISVVYETDRFTETPLADIGTVSTSELSTDIILGPRIIPAKIKKKQLQ